MRLNEYRACTPCGIVYASYADLRRHQRAVHEADTPAAPDVPPERAAEHGDLGWLAGLLTRYRDDVLDRWVEAAAGQPFHFGRRELAVSNHFGRVYDAVVMLLRSAPGTVDHASAWVDPAALLAAEDHAQDRVSQGLEPADIVVEFRLLREETGLTVLRYMPAGVPAGDAIRATLLMNSVFDGALMVILRRLSRHVDEARAAVLATATHDLGQPMTAIKGGVQLAGRALGQPKPDVARIAVSLKNTAGAVDHVVKVLARLAEGARLAIGDVALQRADTDLAEVARQAVARLDPASAERMRLDTPAEGEATGSWDAVALGRVADNLLSNALKYSPPDASVAVVVRPDGEAVELTVADAGIGLEKDEIARLFRRYQRARGAIESAVAGTGLGLYSARAMVEAHRGRIWATSRGRGKGTTVHVVLPRSLPADRPRPHRPRSEDEEMGAVLWSETPGKGEPAPGD
jgi:signal transduction histidine kinase